MSLLVVGGDRLGIIKKKMEELGFNRINHISGRKKGSYSGFKLSGNPDMILVLTDFINHNMMEQVKQAAREREGNSKLRGGI